MLKPTLYMDAHICKVEENKSGQLSPSKWAPSPSKTVGLARTTESATSKADCNNAFTSL